MKTSEELLREAREALAYHEREAAKLRAMISSVEGKPAEPKVRIEYVPVPYPLPQVVPLPPIAPFDPFVYRITCGGYECGVQITAPSTGPLYVREQWGTSDLTCGPYFVSRPALVDENMRPLGGCMALPDTGMRYVS